MKKIAFHLLFALFISCSAAASDGTISVKSPYSVAETADRFVVALNEKGLKLFDRINHSSNAKGAGLELRPTEVIIFGNPKVGTPLMQCAQKVALDLPQRALFWQDEQGQSWVSYNAPNYLKIRYNIEGCDDVLQKISKVLSILSTIATSK